ncbi:MAG TPA: hypothetical protein VLD62_03630, partial [Acidimicrobiia bacterium]|nr:hypothetical protein [Acidimicrobiia bacterium]
MSRSGGDDFAPHPGDPWHPDWSPDGVADEQPVEDQPLVTPEAEREPEDEARPKRRGLFGRRRERDSAEPDTAPEAEEAEAAEEPEEPQVEQSSEWGVAEPAMDTSAPAWPDDDEEAIWASVLDQAAQSGPGETGDLDVESAEQAYAELEELADGAEELDERVALFEGDAEEAEESAAVDLGLEELADGAEELDERVALFEGDAEEAEESASIDLELEDLGAESGRWRLPDQPIDVEAVEAEEAVVVASDLDAGDLDLSETEPGGAAADGDVAAVLEEVPAAHAVDAAAELSDFDIDAITAEEAVVADDDTFDYGDIDESDLAAELLVDLSTADVDPTRDDAESLVVEDELVEAGEDAAFEDLAGSAVEIAAAGAMELADEPDLDEPDDELADEDALVALVDEGEPVAETAVSEESGEDDLETLLAELAAGGVEPDLDEPDPDELAVLAAEVAAVGAVDEVELVEVEAAGDVDGLSDEAELVEVDADDVFVFGEDELGELVDRGELGAEPDEGPAEEDLTDEDLMAPAAVTADADAEAGFDEIEDELAVSAAEAVVEGEAEVVGPEPADVVLDDDVDEVDVAAILGAPDEELIEEAVQLTIGDEAPLAAHREPPAGEVVEGEETP